MLLGCIALGVARKRIFSFSPRNMLVGWFSFGVFLAGLVVVVFVSGFIFRDKAQTKLNLSRKDFLSVLLNQRLLRPTRMQCLLALKTLHTCSGISGSTPLLFTVKTREYMESKETHHMPVSLSQEQPVFQ